jgi:hypothetical protein
VRGKPAPAAACGCSKDHRPDLKQLVWILTVSADGAVPVACRLADGNTADDPTHVPTWDQLVDMLGTHSFLHVADSKLCNGDAMRHIASRRGRFVTLMPRTRSEDARFRDEIAEDPGGVHLGGGAAPARQEERRAGPDVVDVAGAGGLCGGVPGDVGVVHVEGRPGRGVRGGQDRAGRSRARRAVGEARRPEGCRLKTRAAVQEAADGAVAAAGAARWVEATVVERAEETCRQEKRGRPGAKTRCRKVTRTRFTAEWRVCGDVVARDAASDGCFPPVTNTRDDDLADADRSSKHRLTTPREKSVDV